MRARSLLVVAGIVVVVATLGLLRASGRPESAPAQDTTAPVAALPTILDFGRGTCDPCRRMMPVLDTLAERHAGRVAVRYLDLKEQANLDRATEMKVVTIPTQVLLDSRGVEVSRHQGFWALEDIEAELGRIGWTHALTVLATEADLADAAQRLIAESPWLAPAAVFAGGVVTAANPCVLATVPLLMAYVGARDDVHTFRRGVALSVTFVAGLAVVFAALGVVAALAGTMLGDAGPAWDYVVLAVCLLMGAHLIGWLEIPLPSVAVSPRTRGLPGAFLLGGLFGVVSTPCATPILVVVLAYIAGSGASAAYGALLLAAYALGHSVLILAAGASAGLARTLIASERFTRIGRTLRATAGVLIAAVGVFVFLAG